MKKLMLTRFISRVGPIFVYFSILFLIMVLHGVLLMVTQHNNTTVKFSRPKIVKIGNISYIPQSFSWRVNDFDYVY